jgi:hypothetical protein
MLHKIISRRGAENAECYLHFLSEIISRRGAENAEFLRSNISKPLRSLRLCVKLNCVTIKKI